MVFCGNSWSLAPRTGRASYGQPIPARGMGQCSGCGNNVCSNPLDLHRHQFPSLLTAMASLGHAPVAAVVVLVPLLARGAASTELLIIATWKSAAAVRISCVSCIARIEHMVSVCRYTKVGRLQCVLLYREVGRSL